MRCFLCNQEGHKKRNRPNGIRNMNYQFNRLGYDSCDGFCWLKKEKKCVFSDLNRISSERSIMTQKILKKSMVFYALLDQPYSLLLTGNPNI
ncbi:hypothetical protein BpHYR1_044632 [Brachionus plicatilis]|uniref:Uncharacterized protein n=1 Tax=Brachionus plicatilis TaxID=10195 RepID=A0A3M7RWK5_BRAPC|nr:hypothetical protein BpHYR1_044632 [Brachionus plicatilis]